MELKKINLLAAVLAAAFTLPSAAGEPVVDFDRGIDMQAVLESVNNNVAAEKSVFAVTGDSLNASKDCKLFTFRAEDPLVSPPSQLKSYVYQTVCEVYEGKEYCHDKLVRTEERNVSVTLRGRRTALPWEREVFNVCLKDTAVTVKVVEASHHYRIGQKAGPADCMVDVIAKHKIPTAPDSAGITVASWSPASGGLELALKDKWSASYAKRRGDKTLIKVKLKMEKAHWFDPVILEKELLLSPAELYSIDFSKYASEFKHPLQPGQKYFVKWGFRRKGTLSKNTFVAGGETERVFLPLPQ